MRLRRWRRRRPPSLGFGAAVTVLQRKDLEDSPLADLHAIASELGLEGYRALRKEDLIAAILRASGGEAEPDEVEPDEVPSDEALEATPSEVLDEAEAEREAPGVEEEPEVVEEEPEVVEEEPEVVEEEPEVVEEEPEAVEAEPEAVEEEPEAVEAEPEAVEEEPEAVEAEPEAVEEEPEAVEEIFTGVLDVIANGSGFVRVDPAGHSRDDIYVSPAQIRRCELRAGDEVSGPVRGPRRNERHPSLVRVETVNGADAEPPQERPWFGDLTAVFASERLPAPSSLESVPYGKGSRVAIAGPAGAGATTLLREIAEELGRLEDVALYVVLAGVRPEEVTEWRAGEGVEIAGGSFERSPETHAQAAELAVERAKRRVERGGHAALLVDSLAALPTGAQRRLFGAARATDEGGTLTVVATTRDGSEALRWATTRIVLEPGGRPSGAESGTLHADRLG
jgi:transcription termination factor Rho